MLFSEHTQALISRIFRQHDSLSDFFSFQKTQYPFFLLDPNTGTIADATAKDVHTSISLTEEFSVRASITGIPEAADIQESGVNLKAFQAHDYQWDYFALHLPDMVLMYTLIGNCQDAKILGCHRSIPNVAVRSLSTIGNSSGSVKVGDRFDKNPKV